MNSNAYKRQIGGTHYKQKEIQPWHIIEANGLDFFEGNAIKYLLRYKEKGGVNDLDKAVHYIERIKERLMLKLALKEDSTNNE